LRGEALPNVTNEPQPSSQKDGLEGATDVASAGATLDQPPTWAQSSVGSAQWYSAARFYPTFDFNGKETKLKPELRLFGDLNTTGASYIGRGQRPKGSKETYAFLANSTTKGFYPLFDRCIIKHSTDGTGETVWQVCGSGTLLNGKQRFGFSLDNFNWIRLETGAQVRLAAKFDPFLTLSAQLVVHIDLFEALVDGSKVIKERKCNEREP